MANSTMIPLARKFPQWPPSAATIVAGEDQQNRLGKADNNILRRMYSKKIPGKAGEQNEHAAQNGQPSSPVP